LSKHCADDEQVSKILWLQQARMQLNVYALKPRGWFLFSGQSFGRARRYETARTMSPSLGAWRRTQAETDDQVCKSTQGLENETLVVLTFKRRSVATKLHHCCLVGLSFSLFFRATCFWQSQAEVLGRDQPRWRPSSAQPFCRRASLGGCRKASVDYRILPQAVSRVCGVYA